MGIEAIGEKRIETYLTNFAMAYKQGTFAADFVAPTFSVMKSSDKYNVYGKSNFRVINDKIKGREKSKEIDMDVDDDDYSCEEYGQSTFISDRDVQNMDKVGVIRLKEDQIGHLKISHMLSRENRVMAVAGSSSVVTQNSDKAAAWATASSATPVTDIQNAQATVENAVGQIPNRIIMPYDVAVKMGKTDEWRDNFKYTSTDLQSVRQAVEALRNIGLEPMITGARGTSTYKGGASDPAWEKIFANKVLIFYAEPNPTKKSMTFMSSPFTKGNMNKIESYRPQGERGTKYDIYSEIDELLVNAAAAYLLYDVISVS